MCNPLAAVMTVAMVAQSAASISQQNSAAKATTQSATNAYNADIQTLNAQVTQAGDKATTESLAIRKAALRERGSLMAAASGTGLVSPFREQYESMTRESEALAGVGTNNTNLLLQNMAEREKARATNQGRINDAYSKLPSSLTAGLQIATSGAQGAYTGTEYYNAWKGK